MTPRIDFVVDTCTAATDMVLGCDWVTYYLDIAENHRKIRLPAYECCSGQFFVRLYGLWCRRYRMFGWRPFCTRLFAIAIEAAVQLSCVLHDHGRKKKRRPGFFVLEFSLRQELSKVLPKLASQGPSEQVRAGEVSDFLLLACRSMSCLFGWPSTLLTARIARWIWRFILFFVGFVCFLSWLTASADWFAQLWNDEISCRHATIYVCILLVNLRNISNIIVLACPFQRSVLRYGIGHIFAASDVIQIFLESADNIHPVIV